MDNNREGLSTVKKSSDVSNNLEPGQDWKMTEVDDDNGGSCGWFCFRPKWLQKTRSVKVFLFIVSLASIVQGVLVNGFINVFVTSLERRYGISSTESGIIIGAYDMANFIVVLPVSFFGGRPGACKPRWVAVGILTLALGSLIFALPQFTAGPYQISRGDTGNLETCSTSSSSEQILVSNSSSAAESNQESILNNYKYVFILGQLLHGAGATALFTLAVTFIDDNVSNKMQPLYTGLFYMTGTIGPAIGFVGGGQLLRIYTDFLTVPAEKIGIGPDSSLWVGAWWLGFLITGVAGFVIAIPLFAFPAELPGSKAMAKKKLEEAQQSQDVETIPKQTTSSLKESLKEIPGAIKDLVCNLPFLFICLASSAEAFIIAGYGGFLPKIIESQFSVPASTAAFIVGVSLVPSGVIGTLLGGYVIKKFDLKCEGILRLEVLIVTLKFAAVFCFMVYCPEISFAGVNVPYKNNTAALNISDDCNLSCGCSTETYNPVCGIDNNLYYSPCFAGCTVSKGSGLQTLYDNCSCITGAPHSAVIRGTNTTFMASRRNCSSGCNNLGLFVGLLICFFLTLFLATMPAVSAILRCVKSEHRSFALGVHTLTVRVIGSIPGPIVFGIFIDDACRLWQTGSDGTGSCAFYDNYKFSRAMLIVGLIGAGLVVFFIAAAYLAYKKQSQREKDPPKDTVVAYDNPCVDET